MISILIVEDDSSLRTLYSRMLNILGHKVSDAGNGQEAVDVCKLLKPDIILMDYRMPVKNGIEAMKEILQFNNNVKIIFVSADKSIKNEALSLGAVEFVEKPFKLTRLDEIIKKSSS